MKEYFGMYYCEVMNLVGRILLEVGKFMVMLKVVEILIVSIFLCEGKDCFRCRLENE